MHNERNDTQTDIYVCMCVCFKVQCHVNVLNTMMQVQIVYSNIDIVFTCYEFAKTVLYYVEQCF